MPDRAFALTPEALAMIDAIARTGSFAAAARELGKVPSALTYSVRQLEDALDVLLFDRSSRQARFTPAGQELLNHGRRLLADTDAVAQRVRRVASGWEPVLSIAADDVISRVTLLELCESFYAMAMDGQSAAQERGKGGPGTQLRLRTEVMAGTWEALVSGQADLAIGVGMASEAPAGVKVQPMGGVEFLFAVAPCHPLAQHDGPISDATLLPHRAVAVADSAQRLSPVTVNLLPGQDVLTVPNMRTKIDAMLRGLGCGFVPEPMVHDHLAAGRLVAKTVQRPSHQASMGYAWRSGPSAHADGLALQWWLKALASETTRQALLQRHVGTL